MTVLIIGIILVLITLINGFSVKANAHKLIYFDAKGAAELCRILFKINDIEFEDFRFPIKIKEGGGFETPDFDEYKKNGILAANMGRAPLLITNTGVSIGQSKSIERYICRQCKMLGDGEEEALIDCIAENIRDIRDKWGKVRMIGGMGSNPEKEAAIKKFYESELSEWLEKLENSLPKSDSEFAVGTRLSYADIQIWYLMTEVFDKDKVVAASSEKCIRLKAITNNVSKNQNLQKWLEARPQTMF